MNITIKETIDVLAVERVYTAIDSLTGEDSLSYMKLITSPLAGLIFLSLIIPTVIFTLFHSEKGEEIGVRLSNIIIMTVRLFD